MNSSLLMSSSTDDSSSDDCRRPASPMHMTNNNAPSSSRSSSRRSSTSAAAAVGLNFFLLSTRFFSRSSSSSYYGAEAFAPTSWTADLPVLRSRSPSLFAQRKPRTGKSDHPNKHGGGAMRRSASPRTVEQVKPMTSASEERRLSAVQALARQQLKKGSSGSVEDSPLLTDTDAATMLMETFSPVTNGSDNIGDGDGEESAPRIGTARRRMGSVAGATKMSTIRQRAAEEMGMRLSPRDSPDLYRNDGSQQSRRAVGALLEKLEVGISERSEEALSLDDNVQVKSPIVSSVSQIVSSPPKRKRGRPRKNPEATETSQDQAVLKLEPVEPLSTISPAKEVNAQGNKLKQTSESKNKAVSVSKKMSSPPTPTNLEQPMMGASAVVAKQRRRARRKKGNLSTSVFTRSYPEPDQQTSKQTNVATRNPTPDSLNLNRYYRTELLTASEEYSLGMKVKFMVKCEAVHEGLAIHIGRNPTIAEWAKACGFEDYDAEISSENYRDSELDKQIRPAGADAPELDPNMFVGNGLVNDTGVGRGKGRVKKPPPLSLGDFHDDSLKKFNKKKKDNKLSQKEKESMMDAATDIFFHVQQKSPGQPINRGSPRLFREMLLTAKEAKQQMVQCNMRLVVSIARRYHGVGVNVQDLVQEGSLGLARAAEKFDPKKGFKFSTYASWWIQQAVFRSIAYHSRTIRLPVHVHNLLNKVRRARQILQQELGRMPTNEELAQEMDMTVEKYNKMIRSTRNAISLERPKFQNNPKDLGHESETLVGDMVDSSAAIFDEKTPEQSVDHGLLLTDIQYMLKKLGEDERTVLCLRYGVNDGITRTVTLVASEMRQTKSWVRSQECRALRKLRRPWYEKRLKEHRESLQASQVPR